MYWYSVRIACVTKPEAFPVIIIVVVVVVLTLTHRHLLGRDHKAGSNNSGVECTIPGSS